MTRSTTLWNSCDRNNNSDRQKIKVECSKESLYLRQGHKPFHLVGKELPKVYLHFWINLEPSSIGTECRKLRDIVVLAFLLLFL
jgi:hypothetical protein